MREVREKCEDKKGLKKRKKITRPTLHLLCASRDKELASTNLVRPTIMNKLGSLYGDPTPSLSFMCHKTLQNQQKITYCGCPYQATMLMSLFRWLYIKPPWIHPSWRLNDLLTTQWSTHLPTARWSTIYVLNILAESFLAQKIHLFRMTTKLHHITWQLTNKTKL